MKLVKSKSASSNEKENKKPWKRVKIKGNVISEEGFGLEGLIGLEVLESYDKDLVEKGKKTKKLPAWKEKREKAKMEKSSKSKMKKPDSGSECELSSEEEESECEEVPIKKKKGEKKAKKQVQSVPGKFVMLNKAQDDVEQEETDEKTLKMDDLEHWNGLGVPDVILKALCEQGFKTPTEIQALTLPAAIMGKKDILGAAETGSGKTLAFGIPILAGILEMKKRNNTFGIRKRKLVAESAQEKDKFVRDRDNCTPPPEEINNAAGFPGQDSATDESENEEETKDGADKPLYCIVLTPTRELAVQVKDHIVAAAKYTGIKVAAVFGGMAQVKQERILKGCPEIVVATPGRLWELLCQGNPHLNKIDKISFLVIDETDRMVEKGHFEELRMLLKRLNFDETKKEVRQSFVFSATLTLVHDIPDYLQKKNKNRKLKFVKDTPGLKIQKLIEELGISQPKIVDITRSEQTAQNLTESRILCSIDEKDYYLYYFLQRHPGRTIVFCNSIDCVKRLAQLFSILDCQALPLHANMIQKQRLKNLEKFRSRPDSLLIATDVAARGLDIPNIEHVIHYQVPRTSENYVHRSGRTARANKSGITVMIMEPKEVRNYLKLCKTLDRSEDLPLFPVSDRHMKGIRERVNLAREIDTMELKLKKSSSEEGWLKKTAEEMDIVIDSDFDESDSDNEVAMKKSRDKQYLQNKRQALSALLNKPLFPKGFSFKYPSGSGVFDAKATTIETEKSGKNSAVQAVEDSIKDLKEAKRNRKRKNSANEK